MHKMEAELRNMLLFSFLWKGLEFMWGSPWNTYFFQPLFHSVAVLIWILTLLQLLKPTIFSSSISLFSFWFFIPGQGLFQQQISVWNEKVALVTTSYQELIFINLSPKIKGKPNLKCWICLSASHTSWEEIQDTAHWEECPHCVMGVWINSQRILLSL